MEKKKLNPPIGLGREEAAAYVGLSPNTFDELVRIGVFPKPLDLGIRRRIWHIKSLEAAMDRIARIRPYEIPGSPSNTSTNTLLERVDDDDD